MNQNLISMPLYNKETLRDAFTNEEWLFFQSRFQGGYKPHYVYHQISDVKYQIVSTAFRIAFILMTHESWNSSVSGRSPQSFPAAKIKTELEYLNDKIDIHQSSFKELFASNLFHPTYYQDILDVIATVN